MTCDCVVPNIIPANGNGLVYLYTLDNGEQYIGQTNMDIRKRHAMHKYGDVQLVDKKLKKHNWSLKIIGEYPESDLDKMERFYINLLYTMHPNGLNMSEGGKTVKHLTMEQRTKISESLKSIPHIPMSDDTKKKLSEITSNMPQEQRDKIAESVRKLWDDPEYRANATLKLKGRTSPRKGVKLSDETKKKISESKRGKPAWNKGIKATDEQRKRMSELRKGLPCPRKGVKLTIEQKQRISESVKKLWDDPEYRENIKSKKKGHTPWNKGKKGLQVAWNKGKSPSEESRRKMSEAQKRRFSKQ